MLRKVISIILSILIVNPTGLLLANDTVVSTIPVSVDSTSTENISDNNSIEKTESFYGSKRSELVKKFILASWKLSYLLNQRYFSVDKELLTKDPSSFQRYFIPFIKGVGCNADPEVTVDNLKLSIETAQSSLKEFLSSASNDINDMDVGDTLEFLTLKTEQDIPSVISNGSVCIPVSVSQSLSNDKINEQIPDDAKKMITMYDSLDILARIPQDSKISVKEIENYFMWLDYLKKYSDLFNKTEDLELDKNIADTINNKSILRKLFKVEENSNFEKAFVDRMNSHKSIPFLKCENNQQTCKFITSEVSSDIKNIFKNIPVFSSLKTQGTDYSSGELFVRDSTNQNSPESYHSRAYLLGMLKNSYLALRFEKYHTEDLLGKDSSLNRVCPIVNNNEDYEPSIGFNLTKIEDSFTKNRTKEVLAYVANNIATKDNVYSYVLNASVYEEITDKFIQDLQKNLQKSLNQSSLSKKVQQDEKNLKVLESDLATLDSELKTLNSELKTLNNTLKELKDKPEDQQDATELEKITKQIQDKNSEIKSKEDEITNKKVDKKAILINKADLEKIKNIFSQDSYKKEIAESLKAQFKENLQVNFQKNMAVNVSKDFYRNDFSYEKTTKQVQVIEEVKENDEFKEKTITKSKEGLKITDTFINDLVISSMKDSMIRTFIELVEIYNTEKLIKEDLFNNSAVKDIKDWVINSAIDDILDAFILVTKKDGEFKQFNKVLDEKINKESLKGIISDINFLDLDLLSKSKIATYSHNLQKTNMIDNVYQASRVNAWMLQLNTFSSWWSRKMGNKGIDIDQIQKDKKLNEDVRKTEKELRSLDEELKELEEELENIKGSIRAIDVALSNENVKLSAEAINKLEEQGKKLKEREVQLEGQVEDQRIIKKGQIALKNEEIEKKQKELAKVPAFMRNHAVEYIPDFFYHKDLTAGLPVGLKSANDPSGYPIIMNGLSSLMSSQEVHDEFSSYIKSEFQKDFGQSIEAFFGKIKKDDNGKTTRVLIDSDRLATLIANKMKEVLNVDLSKDETFLEGRIDDLYKKFNKDFNSTDNDINIVLKYNKEENIQKFFYALRELNRTISNLEIDENKKLELKQFGLKYISNKYLFIDVDVTKITNENFESLVQDVGRYLYNTMSNYDKISVVVLSYSNIFVEKSLLNASERYNVKSRIEAFEKFRKVIMSVDESIVVQNKEATLATNLQEVFKKDILNSTQLNDNFKLDINIKESLAKKMYGTYIEKYKKIYAQDSSLDSLTKNIELYKVFVENRSIFSSIISTSNTFINKFSTLIKNNKKTLLKELKEDISNNGNKKYLKIARVLSIFLDKLSNITSESELSSQILDPERVIWAFIEDQFLNAKVTNDDKAPTLVELVYQLNDIVSEQNNKEATKSKKAILEIKFLDEQALEKNVLSFSKNQTKKVEAFLEANKDAFASIDQKHIKGLKNRIQQLDSFASDNDVEEIILGDSTQLSQVYVNFLAYLNWHINRVHPDKLEFGEMDGITDAKLSYLLRYFVEFLGIHLRDVYGWKKLLKQTSPEAWSLMMTFYTTATAGRGRVLLTPMDKVNFNPFPIIDDEEFTSIATSDKFEDWYNKVIDPRYYEKNYSVTKSELDKEDMASISHTHALWRMHRIPNEDVRSLFSKEPDKDNIVLINEIRNLYVQYRDDLSEYFESYDKDFSVDKGQITSLLDKFIQDVNKKVTISLSDNFNSESLKNYHGKKLLAKAMYNGEQITKTAINRVFSGNKKEQGIELSTILTLLADQDRQSAFKDTYKEAVSITSSNIDKQLENICNLIPRVAKLSDEEINNELNYFKKGYLTWWANWANNRLKNATDAWKKYVLGQDVKEGSLRYDLLKSQIDLFSNVQNTLVNLGANEKDLGKIISLLSDKRQSDKEMFDNINKVVGISFIAIIVIAGISYGINSFNPVAGLGLSLKFANSFIFKVVAKCLGPTLAGWFVVSFTHDMYATYWEEPKELEELESILYTIIDGSENSSLVLDDQLVSSLLNRKALYDKQWGTLSIMAKIWEAGFTLSLLSPYIRGIYNGITKYWGSYSFKQLTEKVGTSITKEGIQALQVEGRSTIIDSGIGITYARDGKNYWLITKPEYRKSLEELVEGRIAQLKPLEGRSIEKTGERFFNSSKLQAELTNSNARLLKLEGILEQLRSGEAVLEEDIIGLLQGDVVRPDIIWDFAGIGWLNGWVPKTTAQRLWKMQMLFGGINNNSKKFVQSIAIELMDESYGKGILSKKDTYANRLNKLKDFSINNKTEEELIKLYGDQNGKLPSDFINRLRTLLEIERDSEVRQAILEAMVRQDSKGLSRIIDRIEFKNMGKIKLAPEPYRPTTSINITTPDGQVIEQKGIGEGLYIRVGNKYERIEFTTDEARIKQYQEWYNNSNDKDFMFAVQGSDGIQFSKMSDVLNPYMQEAKGTLFEDQLNVLDEIATNLKVGKDTKAVYVTVIAEGGSGKSFLVPHIGETLKKAGIESDVFVFQENALASGTTFRGQLESKVEQLKTFLSMYERITGRRPTVVCDEGHAVFMNNKGEETALSKMLKDFYDKHKFNMIFLSTPQEWSVSYAVLNDPMMSRWTPITLQSMKPQQMRSVFEGMITRMNFRTGTNYDELIDILVNDKVLTQVIKDNRITFREIDSSLRNLTGNFEKQRYMTMDLLCQRIGSVSVTSEKGMLKLATGTAATDKSERLLQILNDQLRRLESLNELQNKLVSITDDFNNAFVLLQRNDKNITTLEDAINKYDYMKTLDELKRNLTQQVEELTTKAREEFLNAVVNAEESAQLFTSQEKIDILKVFYDVKDTVPTDIEGMKAYVFKFKKDSQETKLLKDQIVTNVSKRYLREGRGTISDENKSKLDQLRKDLFNKNTEQPGNNEAISGGVTTTTESEVNLQSEGEDGVFSFDTTEF